MILPDFKFSIKEVMIANDDQQGWGIKAVKQLKYIHM